LTTTALAGVADLHMNSPSADLVEITNGWLQDLPKIAPSVDVRVHYTLVEFDGVSNVSPQRVETVARYFSKAPFVDASFRRAAGHNIEHHRLGPAHTRSVLSFAERCALETYRPLTGQSHCPYGANPTDGGDQPMTLGLPARYPTTT